MKLVALLPVKPFHLSKSRLREVLSAEERQQFVREGLIRTLDVLKEVREVWRILVVSADPLVWEIALKHEVNVYEELDVPGLNESVACGQRWALEHEADTVMILPIDLPKLNTECLRSKILKLDAEAGMVIAPDRHLQGTNFLMCVPPDLIQTAYGEGSFEKHCVLAKQVGVEPVVIYCENLALDIDSPEDLVLMNDRRSRSNGRIAAQTPTIE